MKKLQFEAFILVCLVLFPCDNLHAQGTTTFLSNLAQTSSGTVPVGSDSWIAALFFTGGNQGGYSLNSVQLAMSTSSGTPSGFAVSIFNEGNNPAATLPGQAVGVLTGSANPSTIGTYTFNESSSLILSPGAAYFVVVTSGSTIANGAFEWSLAGLNSYDSSDGWGVTGGVSSGVFKSPNGTSWSSLSATYPQFAINATPAPEPGAIGLLVLGGMAVGFKRWIEKRRS